MKNKQYLRSAEWFGKDDKMGFVHRSGYEIRDTLIICSEEDRLSEFAIHGRI